MDIRTCYMQCQVSHLSAEIVKYNWSPWRICNVLSIEVQIINDEKKIMAASKTTIVFYGTRKMPIVTLPIINGNFLNKFKIRLYNGNIRIHTYTNYE